MQALQMEKRSLTRVPSNELVLAFIAIGGITAIYFLVVLVFGVPGAGEFFGHSLGILGFALMLATETLYSLRKRAGKSGWGRPSSWLKFHIFTGIVGPYLVFLHSAWDFAGLAGLTMLLTGVVVLSGFIGRYIYAFLPRSADGVVLEESEIRDRLQAAERELQAYGQRMPASGDQELGSGTSPSGSSPVSGVLGASGSWFRRPHSTISADEKQREINDLRRQKRKLERQISSLATVRRLFSLWHTLHIPLGMAMFVMAFIHIGAALYYSTMLR